MAYKNIEDSREYQKKWRRQWRIKNPGLNRLSLKKWRESHAEKHRRDSNVWAKNNRKTINSRLRSRYADDPIFRLQRTLRTRLKDYLSSGIHSKDSIDFLGCSVEELKTHIESRFSEGMSWDNYGEWQIDHIVPLSLFLKLEKQGNFFSDGDYSMCLQDAFNYINLQPLWKNENLKKRTKIIF